MGYFPFFIDIAGRECLIVGGGRVALRKIEKLMPFGPEITVVAPEILPEIEALGVRAERRAFEERDLEGRFMAVAATSDRALNRRICGLCRGAGILMNAVDDLESCGFIFPALVKRGDISVGISTSGTAPGAAKLLRRRIEEIVDEDFLRAAAAYAGKRPELKEKYRNEEELAAAADRLLAEYLGGKGAGP